MFPFVTFQIFGLYFSKAGDFQNRESPAHIGRVGIYAIKAKCVFKAIIPRKKQWIVLGCVFSDGKNFTSKINPAIILPVKLKFYR